MPTEEKELEKGSVLTVSFNGELDEDVLYTQNKILTFFREGALTEQRASSDAHETADFRKLTGQGTKIVNRTTIRAENTQRQMFQNCSTSH